MKTSNLATPEHLCLEHLCRKNGKQLFNPLTLDAINASNSSSSTMQATSCQPKPGCTHYCRKNKIMMYTPKLKNRHKGTMSGLQIKQALHAKGFTFAMLAQELD